MKKLLASSIIFSILIITACTPQQVTGTLEVRVTLPSPTETPTPLPTPSPESLLPQTVKEKFETAGIDLADMQNAKYDKNGLSITLESGEVVLLTNEELEKNIFLGQDNVLQYRDESNQNVIYAYDKESGKWAEAIKEFSICAPENFRDCEISVEELFNGDYFHWLQTLSKPFDQSKIKDVPLVMLGDDMIVYDWETAPNFEDPLTAPFRRDVTLGIVFLEIEGVQYPYVVKPIEFFDKNEPQKNKWVITVRPFGDVKRGFWGEEDMDSWVRLWQEEMDTTPIMTSAFLYADYPDESLKNLEDPLVKRTFDNNPDMETRFDRFMAGEVGALSEPGIVLSMGYVLIIPD